MEPELEMEFLLMAEVTEEFKPLEDIFAKRNEVICAFSERSKWLPKLLQRRGRAVVKEPHNPRRLLSFLRACARHENGGILVAKKQITRDGKKTSRYYYRLIR